MKSTRFDGIDILRGLSILAVILLHINIRLELAQHPPLPPLLFHFLFWNGNNGVTIFFAVSGFLITTTSLRRFGGLEQMKAGMFYRIRFARIAPLLLLLLAVLSVLHLTGVPGYVIQRSTLPTALFAALTFHLNWLEATNGYLPACWDVLWSLSIEEMFYLVFPLVCKRRSLFLAILLILVVIGPFARTVLTHNEIWQEKSYLGCMDAIALGCLAALVASRIPQRFSLALNLTGAALMLLITIWPPWHGMRFIGRTGLDGTLLPIGTCLVMIGSVLEGRRGTLWSAPIRWFGRHSYEVYLTHEFVIIAGASLHMPLLAILALAAIPGAILARYYSEPLNAFIRE